VSRSTVHRAIVARYRTRYDALLAIQGGVCALCGNPPKEGGRRLNIDHDHRGMLELRGLLCFRCNRALPDYVDAAWLRRAAEYLENPPALHLERGAA
jgi:hypothetical protein